MTTEELTESFNTWWQEEGILFISPQLLQQKEIKIVMLMAWLNGAHIAITHNT